MSIRFLRKGMNLIELSIVVMILGVLFSGLFGAYYTSLKISKNADPKKGASRRDIYYALENIRSTFAQTYYMPAQKRLIFIGKGDGGTGQRKDRIAFAANHSNSEETGTPSVREVSFHLKQMPKNPEYYYLIRREDEMVDVNPETGGVEHILLDHVKSFQLKYSLRGDKWQDEWDSKELQRIPKLVRIELIVLTGNQELRFESLSYPGLLFK